MGETGTALVGSMRATSWVTDGETGASKEAVGGGQRWSHRGHAWHGSRSQSHRVGGQTIRGGRRTIILCNMCGQTAWGHGLTASHYNACSQTAWWRGETARGTLGASSWAVGQTAWGRSRTTVLYNGGCQTANHGRRGTYTEAYSDG
jgi:hypothetical protein